MIRVALIGLGKMGLSHLALIRPHPLVELVAVCDPTPYITDVLGKYTGIKTYSDHKSLFANETLDAVVIATPSRFHGELVRIALDRGIHVFCEKPFCLDLGEAEELAARADALGLINQVGYHYRFVGALREARRLVAANAIGRIHHIRAEAYGPVVLRPKNSTWRTKKAEGGGCLYDYASHAIDTLNYIFGPPRGVSGSVLNRIFSNDVDDEVYATLHYANGATGQLAANWSDESFRKMSLKISIWGEQGRINADRQEVQVYSRRDDAAAFGLEKGWNTRYTTDLTDEVWFYLRGEEYSAQMDCFFRQIETGKQDNTVSFRSALETDRVIHHILRDSEGKDRPAAPSSDAPAPPRGMLERVFGGRR